MAKQSAKSKGYRKTVKKKPFLTKKEIIELVVIVAAIVIGIVAFNLFYDDGYMTAADVHPSDVVSYVSRDITGRYVKVATANELPGFTCEQPDLSENPRAIYNYIPDEPTDNIEYISLSGSYVPAESQVSSVQSALGAGAAEFTEQQTTQIQGHDAYVYSYTSSYYSEEKAAETEAPAGDADAAEAEAPAENADAAEDEAPAEDAAANDAEAPAEDADAADAEAPAEDADAEGEENAPNVFSQTVGCYVNVDDYTLCFHIYRTGDDESFYLPEDQIVDYLLPYTDAFTIYEAEKK